VVVSVAASELEPCTLTLVCRSGARSGDGGGDGGDGGDGGGGGLAVGAGGGDGVGVGARREVSSSPGLAEPVGSRQVAMPGPWAPSLQVRVVGTVWPTE